MTIIIINKLISWIFQLLTANFWGGQIYFLLSSLKILQTAVYYLNLHIFMHGNYGELVFLFNLEFTQDLVALLIIKYYINNFSLIKLEMLFDYIQNLFISLEIISISTFLEILNMRFLY